MVGLWFVCFGFVGVEWAYGGCVFAQGQVYVVFLEALVSMLACFSVQAYAFVTDVPAAL